MTNKRILLGHRTQDELPIPPSPWESRHEKAERDRSNRQLGRKNDPVELDLDHLLSGHAVVRGRSGQGKTQLILVKLLNELMAPYTVEWEEVVDG